MTDDILGRVNALSAHLARYKPTRREIQVGRSVAYHERLCQGNLPMRQYKTKVNRGQVPLIVRQGELQEVMEFGQADA